MQIADQARKALSTLCVLSVIAVCGAAPGTGLGLSIVCHLVECHGGNIAAFSEGPGKGAEFVVRLPLHPAASAQA